LKELSPTQREAIRKHIIDHVRKDGGVPTAELEAMEKDPNTLLKALQQPAGHLKSFSPLTSKK
jgi:hypothetical protein